MAKRARTEEFCRFPKQHRQKVIQTRFRLQKPRPRQAIRRFLISVQAQKTEHI